MGKRTNRSFISSRRRLIVVDRASLVAGTYRPNETTSGVPLELKTSLVDDTLTSPVSNTTYTNRRFIANVKPAANTINVTFNNCEFVGSATVPASFTGLCSTFNTGVRNIVFNDCTFKPRTPHHFWIGIQGGNFVARRCDFSHVVDAFSTFPGGGVGTAETSFARAEANYIHDMAYWLPAVDATHSDGSHTDALQLQGGEIEFVGNHATGFLAPEYAPNFYGTAHVNATLMLKPDVSSITALIDRNWLYGGAATINIAHDDPRFIANNAITITNNRFGRDTREKWNAGATPLTVSGVTGLNLLAANNVYDDNGTAISIRSSTTSAP